MFEKIIINVTYVVLYFNLHPVKKVPGIGQ